MGAAARDMLRTPEELVFRDRLLELGAKPNQIGLYENDYNFPHDLHWMELRRALPMLWRFREDPVVKALAPKVCESLWRWVLQDIPWPQPRSDSPISPKPKRTWVIFGETRERARSIQGELERYSHEWRQAVGKSTRLHFRCAWRLLSPHMEGHHWYGWDAANTNETGLVFGGSRDHLIEWQNNAREEASQRRERAERVGRFTRGSGPPATSGSAAPSGAA